jgi:hypothetical protein
MLKKHKILDWFLNHGLESSCLITLFTSCNYICIIERENYFSTELNDVLVTFH